MYIEAAVQTSGGQIRSNVQENLFSIGYLSVGSLNDSIKALDIDGVTPSAETIINGTYPIQRPFLIVTNNDNDADELVQDFIRFALSAEGQAITSDGWTSPVADAEVYTPGGLSGTLRIGGSTSVDPLMQQLRTAYIALNPNVRIEISGGGSGTGISEATSGVIDIGMSSRELREGEKAALNEYTIALDGVAVIVNTANPVNNMDMETVRKIFTGEITTWRDIIG
jgi:phosphate transport system substrate-binding protein